MDIMKGQIGEHQRYGRHTNQCNGGNPKEWFEIFEYSHGRSVMQILPPLDWQARQLFRFQGVRRGLLPTSSGHRVVEPNYPALSINHRF